MHKHLKFQILLVLIVFLFGAALAEAQSGPASSVKLGKVTVSLAGPEGLTRVDGRDAQVDAYVKAAAKKFKVDVQALYADEAEWQKYVTALKAGKSTPIPRLALVLTPRKMAKKNYDMAKVRKEFKKYNQWFDLAANNRPMAAVLTGQANSKLKEYLGQDMGFKFKTGSHTRKLAETSGTISFGAEVSFKHRGVASEGLLTATSANVGDKLVFIGYYLPAASKGERDAAVGQALLWRSSFNSANASASK